IRNETDFPLEVVVLYDDEQNLPEQILEETGTESVFTLAPGEVRSVTRECDDLQIVRVSVDLQLLGGLGPSRTSRVYRDGDDFRCGNRIVFIYTAPAVPTRLELSVLIEE